MKVTLFIALCVIWSMSNLRAQERGLEPLDVAKMKIAEDIVLHHDAPVGAYTVRIQADPIKENKPAWNELHLLDLESGEGMPFVTRGNVRQIAFRPEHQTITFLNKLEGDETTSLYEISLEGGEASKLFSWTTSISSYHWSPDGGKLAFTAQEVKEDKDSKLPYQPEIYEGEPRYTHAFVTDLHNDTNQLKLDANFRSIQWSPDGKHLAVITSPTPLIDDFYMKSQISIVDGQDLSVTHDIDHASKLGALDWSPDSRQIAFIAGADIHDPIDGRLFVCAIENGKPQQIFADFEGKFEDIDWIQTNRIQFVASQGVGAVFGHLSPEGSNWQEEYSSQDLILHEAETMGESTIFLADSPQHPTEIYLWENNMPKRLSDLNPWLKDIRLATQEVVNYTAADGVEIQGILIRPLDQEDGEEYPLITVVHGGPESHYDNGWLTSYSMPGQMAAAKGYAVFYPNYRGSTGRGLEFAMSSQGDLAGKEFDDVVNGVDFLIESGLVDPDRVGVTGGSYGGYATGWLSTKYTDRFAAGVMFVGISDNISKWGTSDIPEELYLVHARKRLWEDYQFFLERSPIYYAGQTQTPLLIMAGKEDTRVHPAQSIELYRHIKTRTDTPVQLILYPGEGHGNRNSTARYDYNLRQLNWFENYLKGRT